MLKYVVQKCAVVSVIGLRILSFSQFEGVGAKIAVGTEYKSLNFGLRQPQGNMLVCGGSLQRLCQILVRGECARATDLSEINHLGLFIKQKSHAVESK